MSERQQFNMREWLSWWSTTLPRSGSRVRVPSRALSDKRRGIRNGCLFFVFNKDMVTLSFRCFPYKVNMKKKQGFTFSRNFPNIVKDKKKNRGIAMKFIYTRIKDEIRIDKIEDPEAVIYVPEQFEDCPVTELGSYVLAHS